jgi:DNA transformation protein and related proteins
MFGGWGFKCDGLMVGLIYNDELYLKVDVTTKPQLLAAGGHPFLYETPEKRVEMPYVTAPEAAMDARHFMAPWARLAMEAALRSANAKPPKRVPATRKVAARTVEKPAVKKAGTSAKKAEP